MSRATGDLLTLLQISDSAFPSGAFAFSAGLESLVAESRVKRGAGLAQYLKLQILPRWLSFDRWYLHAAHAADTTTADGLAALDADCDTRSTVGALAEASCRTGRAMLSSHSRIGTLGAADWLAEVKAGRVHGHAPVVQGLVARGLGLDAELAAMGALHGTLAALASAAVRLGAVGALEAQGVLRDLAPAMAEGLGRPPPKEPFSFSPLADIAAMRHADGSTRLFSN